MLLNPIQPRSVHRNLIIHLISLINDATDVPILRVKLFAHGLAELAESAYCSFYLGPVKD